MSRRPAKVTQTEIARVLRAAAALDGVYQVEIAPDGTIRIAPVDQHHISAEPTADPAKWEERMDANPDWK